jgi:hyaluronan synthase
MALPALSTNRPAPSGPLRFTPSSLAGLFPLLGALISLVIACLLHAESDDSWARLLRPLGILVVLHSAHTALFSVLWLRYRRFDEPEGATWPTVSVIIPAFNEGPMVERSIRSAALSDYPRGLLELIIVDDGSRDDTFFHMRHLRREFPELVRLVRFRGNRGKRAALLEGFEAARGEIVLTIDSDSEVEPSTVREMVKPFLADARVGAVAGRVAVLNRDSFISRMLEVQYALAFDFARAAQSVYRAVACCPGALSAFRRGIILPHLREWAQQQFLGRPVSHGEDQALTNIVLRAGYDTVYQSSAVVHTLAPTRYRQLSRMFVRWDRSYIVEGFSFAKFMLTAYRRDHRLLPIVGFAFSTLRVVGVFYLVLGVPALFDTLLFGSRWHELLGVTLAMLAGASFTALYYLKIERSFRFLYGIAYAVFSALCLQWILPWAMLTVRDERWGTR